jgi:hypothetical protein
VNGGAPVGEHWFPVRGSSMPCEIKEICPFCLAGAAQKARAEPLLINQAVEI